MYDSIVVVRIVEDDEEVSYEVRGTQRHGKEAFLADSVDFIKACQYASEIAQADGHETYQVRIESESVD